jgi:hypothetical protein
MLLRCRLPKIDDAVDLPKPCAGVNELAGKSAAVTRENRNCRTNNLTGKPG